MKKEIILKTIFILMISVIILTIQTSVYAATSGSSLLDDFLEDQGSLEDLENTNTDANTNTDVNTNTGVNTNTDANTNTNTTTTTTTTNTNTNTSTNLPEAGLVEDTMLIVAIAVLGIVTVYAYKKVNEYQSI